MGKPERPRESTFADRLTYARAVWELTHGSPGEADDAFTVRAGVTFSWFRKWKQAPEYRGQADELRRLADALECSMDWLTGSAVAAAPMPERWPEWIAQRRLAQFPITQNPPAPGMGGAGGKRKRGS